MQTELINNKLAFWDLKFCKLMLCEHATVTFGIKKAFWLSFDSV